MTIDNINPLLKSLERPISWFKQDPHNARLHGARNLQSIRDSLTKFAQQKPIVCLNDGTVVAGNGTLSAASALGWTKLAAVIFTDEAKAKAYAIADNRSAELAEWDLEQLGKTLAELNASGATFESLGFTDYEAAPIVQADWTPPAVDPEYVPPDTGGKRSVTFTKEEWNELQPHLAKVKQHHPDATDGQAIVVAVCGRKND